MSDKTTEFLSDEDAARLWKRAAELQAEAARLAESEMETPALEEEADDPTEGYALSHVRQAAVEAGIGERFVEAALVEYSADQVLPAPPTGLRDRLARRWLNDPVDNIAVSRTISAPVESVLSSMERIFPEHPFKLLLKNQHGPPRSGGVLVFDIEGAGWAADGWTAQASWADMREVYASVRRIDESSCELTVRSPVAWARGLNVVIGSGLAAVGGGVGGVGGLVVGGLLTNLAVAGTGLMAPIVLAVGLAVGVAGGVGASTSTVAWLYERGIGKGRKALTTLVSAVAVDAQGGWGISMTGGPERPALPASGATDPER